MQTTVCLPGMEKSSGAASSRKAPALRLPVATPTGGRVQSLAATNRVERPLLSGAWPSSSTPPA